ncbi:hypothetical protein IJI94_01745 [Candidatus Saccharibacteria bacterium]|nr:hypothetical protein [Candidatus Saccharibacteria bacterium]
MREGEPYHNDAGGVSEYNDFEAAMANEPVFNDAVEKQLEAEDDFSPERLEEVYPKGENESDEDYEKRIEGMKKAAEEAGPSKMEKGANKDALEKIYRERKERLEKRLEENSKDVADIIGDGYQDDDNYKNAVEKQRAKNEASLRELRNKIDAAVEAGEEANLISELEKEDALEDAFEKSQTEEYGLDGKKVSEVKAEANERAKEQYAQLKAVKEDIKKLEDELAAAREEGGKFREGVEEERARVKERLDKTLEAIDAQANVNDEHKDILKQKSQERYEGKLEEIRASHEDEAKALRDKHDKILKEIEEKKKEQENIEKALGETNEDRKKGLAEIRDRFDETIGTEEEQERYNKFLEEHEAENLENLEKTGRVENKKQEPDDEINKGIVGEDGGSTAFTYSDESGNPPEKGDKDTAEFFKELEKWRNETMAEAKQRYDEAIKGIEEKYKVVKERDIDLAGLSNEDLDAIGAAIDKKIGTKEIDLAGLSIDDLDDIEAAINKRIDNVADTDLSDDVIRDKYKMAKYYVEGVKIEDNVAVEKYIEQMKSAFKGEDLNDDAWELLEEKMRDRYDRVRENQERMRGTGEKSTGPVVSAEAENKKPLNIEKGTEEYAKTPEGKIEILKGDIDGVRNVAEFIRNLEREDVEGVKVYEIMDKVVRPKFFPGFDVHGNTKAKYDKLMDKLTAKYAEFGLNAKGEVIDDGDEIKNKVKRKKISNGIWKRLGLFRRGE